ncbi:hypothetical protein DEM27_06505 [Metarhizobium album]|uniref:Uncharacterized protein n=1 Tax=Metarhizobium album TaxID=2182425 RepID=A0A2U2DVF3_9HYPH|nr:hypothetical protein [Rhizobium album]PWE57284.1 hypothetical protein DEM27_06505 [Rhizobium album]
MDPRQFLEVILKPNVAEALEKFKDLRSNFNAVATADAMAAHIFYWAKKREVLEVAHIKDDLNYRLELRRLNAHMALLFDVAKALKHVELERGNPMVKAASEVDVRSFGYGEGGYGVGPYGGGPQVSVFIEGRKIQLASLFHGAIEVYELILNRMESWLAASDTAK